MVKQYENIRAMIEDISVKFSDNKAFVVKEKMAGKVIYKNITFKKLREETEAFSRYLIAHGLQGKRIAVIGKNSYNWMLVYLSALCSGSVIVPLDKGLLEYEIKEQLERSEADAVFYAKEFESVFAHIEGVKCVCTDSDEFKSIVEEGYSLKNSDEYQKIKIDADAMSILLFTSGTTSKSKAVMLSHRNILSDVYGMSIWEKFLPTDVNLAILPFHHTFGMTQIVLFLAHGMCNVFCEGVRIAKALTEYKVTVLVAVPRIVEEMRSIIMRKLKSMNKVETVNKGIKLTSFLRKVGIDIRRKIFKDIIDGLGGGLRCIIVGAAPSKPDVLEWFNAIGILTVQGYGLTETSPCLAAENEKCLRRGSVGKALPNVELKICDTDENGIGEIAAKGEMVMLGYYKAEDETAKVMKDGYFHTGDMGYIDRDGYLFITGRKKNVIVLKNGKNVFPEELEFLLEKCEAVRECIVYNEFSDSKDCISAKIVYNTDFDEEKAKEVIDSHIKTINESLIFYKQIKNVEITDKEMEKTTTLKIKR